MLQRDSNHACDTLEYERSLAECALRVVSSAAAAESWLESEIELLKLAAQKFGNNWERISTLFAHKSPQACEQKFMQISSAAPASTSNVAASAPAAASSSAASSTSIIPASGLSHTAKLLFVTSKLYTRNLLSREEKRILKQLAIRGDAGLFAIDLASESFLTQLIDTASAIAITNASHTFHNWLYQNCSTNHGSVRDQDLAR